MAWPLLPEHRDVTEFDSQPFMQSFINQHGNDVTNDFEFKRARFSENGGKVHVPERRLVSVSKSDRLGRGVVAALRESVVRGG